MKQPCKYIIADKRNGTLYIGVTSDLVKRIYLHRNSLVDGLIKKYNCKILVFYKQYATMESAILREKQIKARSRKKKLTLIESLNPN